MAPPSLAVARGWVFLALLPAGPLCATLTGPPITDNDFNVDLSMGPVYGSGRMVGLGGAYVGVAEGADGVTSNPASLLHYHKETEPRWRPGFTIGWFKALGKDFDNNGSETSTFLDHQVVDAGITLQHGKYGLGFHLLGQPIQVQTGDRRTEFSFLVSRLVLGRSFLDRELHLALAAVPVTLEARDKDSGSKLFKMGSASAEIGALWNPRRGALRLGLAYRGRTAQDQPLDTSAGPARAAGLFLPAEVELPWQVSGGASYLWSSVLGGRKLLVATQWTVVGKARNAVGIESFLEQKVQRSGQVGTMSVHGGMEIEILPRLLRARLGNYFEPSRFEGVSDRAHVTGGLEWGFSHYWMEPDSTLTVQYAFDVSRRYSKHSIALGIWRF